MKIQNRLSRFICILMVLFLANACGNRNRNSDTITNFLLENPRLVQGLHFYPSTTRMLGKMMGDEYGIAFKDIQSGRFLYVWNSENFDLSANFDRLIENAKSEGFEVLVEMDNADGKNAVYLSDQGTPIYLLFLENEFGDFIVELTGDISLNSIYQLTQLDYSSITDNLPNSRASETVAEPSQEEMIE